MSDKRIKISSGFLRGKMINIPDTPGTRPTKSIVRECVFNVLRAELVDAVFIEAFGGSASMAIEAISNYAKRAHVCELGAKAIHCARANCDGLDICVHVADAFEMVPQIIKNERNGGEFVILYLDPPFSIRDGFSEVYERILGICKGANIVAIEHESAVQITDLDDFDYQSTRKFGKTSVSFFSAK